MPKEQLYKKYAKFYDKVYSKKKYEAEVEFINSVVKIFKVKGKNLLDMACGTGTHAKKFVDNGFRVTGVDVNSEMLKLAKKKTKKASFVEGSMQSFKSKKKFDVITCLFTAINYNKNVSELKSTIKNFSNLLNKGGIVIFDLGLIKGKEDKKTGAFIDTYSEDNLQIARISQWNPSRENSDIYNANFLMLIKDKGKVDFEIDEHELGIFSVEEIKSIMENNGFAVKIYDDFSLKKYTKKSKRPIFVGQK
jgi:ubiquinone/menaquinone biosynthesis C-methylase UbiE